MLLELLFGEFVGVGEFVDQLFRMRDLGEMVSALLVRGGDCDVVLLVKLVVCRETALRMVEIVEEIEVLE